MSTGPEIITLFGTPVVISDVPDAATLNAELRKVIEQRQKSHPSTQHSNLGGWQSSWDMDRWGGTAAIRLLAIGGNLANRFTTDRQGRYEPPFRRRRHATAELRRRCRWTTCLGDCREISATSGRCLYRRACRL